MQVEIPISIHCLYLVPFLTYSTSNNGLPLKSWLGVTQRHWELHHWIDHIRFPIRFPFFHCNYGISCIISEIKLDIGRKSQFLCFIHCNSC